MPSQQLQGQLQTHHSADDGGGGNNNNSIQFNSIYLHADLTA
jgi:hypothetical protein